MYKDWLKQLPAQVAVCPIQLPGRSTRFHEPPYHELHALIPDIAEAIRPLLDRPFVFMGHSMGALISFELARYVRKLYALEPVHLLMAGFHAPHMPDPGPIIHHLPDPEFMAELTKLNGTPKELIEHAELMELMLPMLKADFTLAEQYVYQQGEPFTCPITAFGGWQDPDISVKEIQGWKEQTTGAFRAYMLEGDHFFIHSQEKDVLRIIRAILEDLLRKY